MGIINFRGAGAGLGAAMEESGLTILRSTLDEQRQARLAELQAGYASKAQERGFAQDEKMVGVRETSRQQGRLADIEQDTNPDIIAKKGAAASGLIRATLPAKVEEKTALGQAETKLELERFEKLAPVKRQSAIDDALAVLTAKSTPEALKQQRAIAMSTHIVDPSYTLIPNADGTVTTFDTKSGKSGGQLKDASGEPIIRKDPEELKAATAVINMAATNLKIAQAEHKATMADVGATPAEKAAATSAWESAQAEARRVSAPAYAVLYAKAKMPDTGASTAVQTGAPEVGTEYNGFVFKGGNPRDKSNWELKRASLPLAEEPPGSEPHQTVTQKRNAERARNEQRRKDREEKDKALRDEYGQSGY